MERIYKKGFPFGFDPEACRSCCGNCCRGKSGHIWLNHEEIGQISSYLKTNIIDFIVTYLVRHGNRYSIQERVIDEDCRCTFFDEEILSCSIYPARPLQCRTFPFWDYFRENFGVLEADCLGIRML